MSVKLAKKKRACPYCKKVVTKRRIKQYFHHSCFVEMVKESKVKYNTV